jgi:hypothetical protein
MKHDFEQSTETNAIFSDDPNALDKLKEKVKKLEEDQEFMKYANKLIKKHKTQAEQVKALMDELNIPEGKAYKITTPDFAKRIGFPSYMLTNNNANIRRIKDRIATLEKLATVQDEEFDLPGNVSLRINTDANRLQVLFPGKPDYNVRSELKGYGFKWAPSEEAWQRHLSGVHNVEYYKNWLTKLLSPKVEEVRSTDEV